MTHIFFEEMHKNWQSEKIAQVKREQMHPICCYSSSENINCRSIQAARKKYANNIKRAPDF